MANIQSQIDAIRQARYGRDVRESIASGMEAMNGESSTAYSAAITAQTSATNSATNAAQSASDAQASATVAQTAEQSALATIATVNTYKTEAKDSADAAKASETAAKNSETNAKASETIVKNAEASVAAQVATVTQAVTDARQAVTDANTAKTQASQYASNAATSATTAANSQTAAGISATNAKDSENKAYQYAQEAKSISGIGIATTSQAGIVMPDGSTVSVNSAGQISVAGLSEHIADTAISSTSNPDGVHGIRLYTNEVSGKITLQKWDTAAQNWVDQVDGFKVDGTTITVDPDGTLHGVGDYTLPKATDTTLGGVKIGDNVSVSDGTISIAKATGTTLGVVKGGGNITIDGTGKVYIDKTFTPVSLAPANWQGTNAPYTYDLGVTDTDVELEVMMRNTATTAQVEACVNAQISGNADDNLLRAWGDKPTVDIPVMVRKVAK